MFFRRAVLTGLALICGCNDANVNPDLATSNESESMNSLGGFQFVVHQEKPDTASKLSAERPLGYRENTFINLKSQFTDDLKGVRGDMTKAIQAYLDNDPNAENANLLDQQSLDHWFYDCSSSAVVVCNILKKTVSILVHPGCGIDECNLVLIDRDDLHKLALDPEILRSVHRSLNNKLPQSRLALVATEVVSYEELCKRTGKSHVQLKQ